MIYLILSAISLICLFLYWQDNSLSVKKYEYDNKSLPTAFSGYRIVQISDLHCKLFGKQQNRLINVILSLKPDIIVVTGDLIDRRRLNVDKSLCFIKRALSICPIYFVPGNHEAWYDNYSDFRKQLLENGVFVMENQKQVIFKDNESIEIIGLRDPRFTVKKPNPGINTREVEEYINNNIYGENFKILLSHRPEIFDIYQKGNVDIVFCGHAHGGQIRLPIIGGIWSPNQGLFPQYSAGRYDLNKTTMFLSRGLGNSIFPFRVFNRPEVVFVELKSK